ncbi:uncharacterized protein LACBIDRAFT_305512 [Laccaria bicolor S238N-H82]|uniref:Predicted protein n=1 Tax=Laccaria bicolor (strain S238N-H82 / ATCC MYA-4686) TaxID=486041 RepID=B0CUF2_LACBS|nr:uncharacterized protein LACBIDRAFT_305512 [Laccaria bicolor S238N-H82]EDR14660.1 predicted protein [Laccaria bicolor S238N-H82]|eukprot:XP_001875219.1 predicted protein [Laccaria bicolor S238N-H82]
MALLPFSISYLILTPRHVRLPEGVQVPPAPRETPKSPVSTRWSADLARRAKSFRSQASNRLSSPTTEAHNETEDLSSS